MSVLLDGKSPLLTAETAPERGARGSSVIRVRGLTMRYGRREAVSGVDLDVGPGQIFAFLGPNGAGKTTTVEILEGYRRRTAGEVEVLGVDPARAGAEWRDRIGVVLQSCQPEPELTVLETVRLYAGFYCRPLPPGQVLELVGLGAEAGKRTEKLSGGQQRRLDVGLALVGDPDLVFLDEPTTGFDPAARRAAWRVIAGLRDLGKTVFLTTHYLDEADALADRMAVIVDGRIVAEGPPSTIAGRAETSTVGFRVDGRGTRAWPRGWSRRVEERDGRVELASADPLRDLAALSAWAESVGCAVSELTVRRPSLEDVYLRLTGDIAPEQP
ncbi:MAG TPA: ABC transporter ATP-binding protein [Acidimicrobiales bacterium]|nr:ABC transporter ATP-binding protein [Acidimicrobiales bacterium]